MRFEWDESKRTANVHKHGIDFIDAVRIFESETITFEDDRFSYHEARFWTIGILGTVVIVVVHTYSDENTIRVISARKATNHEQRRFFF